MLGYILSRATFSKILKEDITTFSVPIGSTTGETGSALLSGLVPEDLTEAWLYLAGEVSLITQTVPQNKQLSLRIADPILAFDRKLIWPEDAPATYGEFIKDVLEREYINCPDPKYRLSYLQVSNTDATPLVKPELDDTQIYTLSDIMVAARKAGVSVLFRVTRAPNKLLVEISTMPSKVSNIFFNDGHAQLASETHSRDVTAKVTVLKEVDEGAYDTFTYYLSIDGSISSEMPDSRPEGKWEYVKIGKNDVPLEKASEVFGKNIESHQITFYSDRRYRLCENVKLRINGRVYQSKITYIGKASGDSRFSYKCGELAVTAPEKIRAIDAAIKAANLKK